MSVWQDGLDNLSDYLDVRISGCLDLNWDSPEVEKISWNYGNPRHGTPRIRLGVRRLNQSLSVADLKQASSPSARLTGFENRFKAGGAPTI